MLLCYIHLRLGNNFKQLDRSYLILYINMMQHAV